MNLKEQISQAKNNGHNFYVYGLINKNSGSVIYVGKGSGDRIFNHANHAKKNPTTHLHNLIKKNNFNIDYVIFSFHVGEDDAYLTEEEFILLYGRKDLKLGHLINHNNGGRRGYSPSAETRKKISINTKTAMNTKEIRTKISEGTKNAYQKKTETEKNIFRNKQSTAALADGVQNKRLSNINWDKFKETQTLCWANSITRENRTKHWSNPVIKEKHKAAINSSVVKQKMKDSAKNTTTKKSAIFAECKELIIKFRLDIKLPKWTESIEAHLNALSTLKQLI